MKRNAALFNVLADRIEQNPDEYDQETWGTSNDPEGECGGSYCIAGTVAMLLGAEPRTVYALSGALSHYSWDMVTLDGVTESPGKLAGRVLGLDEDEQLVLFSEVWHPDGMSVPEALRSIAEGVAVGDVTYYDDEDAWS